MIKARVSKNLRGTMMLPTVSPLALSANTEVFFTEEQLYAADIQGALNKKLLIMVDGPSQKQFTSVKVTNLSFSSISLPNVGIVRAGKTMDIRSDLVDTPVYRKMVQDGLIAFDLQFKTGKPQIEEIAAADIKRKRGRPRKEALDISIPANMQKGRAITVKVASDSDGNAEAVAVRGEAPKSQKAAAKKGTLDAKKKHGIRRLAEEDLLIDPNAPDTEEDAEDFLLDPRTGKKVTGDDGIIFVDAEQAEARRASHPVLRNKKNGRK